MLLETDIKFHELTDPPGIKFWPKDKGRDGCRTPMVWDSNKTNGGFSDVKPWLPVKSPQLEKSVTSQKDNPESVLNHYKNLINFRKRSKEIIKGDIKFISSDDKRLAFSRSYGGSTIFCFFNFSKEDVVYKEIIDMKDNFLFSSFATLKDNQLILGPNGFAFIKPLN